MLYREAGQFKTNYQSDQAIFPIAQDRWFVIALVAAAYLVVPMIADDYWYDAVLIPFLVASVAAIGLNILTGYCGQISLGTGGFMAVGAYSAYKLTTAFPDLHIVFVFVAAGVVAALVGVIFGLPSLRIKGFYLAVATLAAQFFLEWLFLNKPWFVNYHPSGVLSTPPREVFGVVVTGATAPAYATYLFALTIAVVGAILAKNLVRGRIGRAWMAIRDMDIAAELIGIRPLQTKLLAFAISSFYVGIAGAMLLFLSLNAAEAEAFNINRSFLILFMVIIGGLGSIMGSFMGAAFITLFPVLLTNAPHVLNIPLDSSTAKDLELMIFGGFIVFLLIVEPAGMARLWSIAKEKLRLWPFPY
jgi:branched-chain amino acid transport system permease protein